VRPKSTGLAVSDSVNRPLTLKEAAERYGLTVSTLRAEASRGRLHIFRIGKRDYTMPDDVQEMIRQCRENDPRRAFTSTRQEGNGLSETVNTASAQASLNRTVQALKNASLNTSAKSTCHKTAPTH
jgi:hypothetical protein